MSKITFLSLHIINQVRLRRFIIGMSSRKLSELLNHSEGYVGMIESQVSQTQYPPHEWPKFAEALDCKVHDFLPAGQSKSTGKLVDKIVISLINKNDLVLVLDGMKTYGFFEQKRTIDEVAKYLFLEKAEQLNVLDCALTLLTEAGKLNLDKDRYFF